MKSGRGSATRRMLSFVLAGTAASDGLIDRDNHNLAIDAAAVAQAGLAHRIKDIASVLDAT